MPLYLRPLDLAELPAAAELGRLAFGGGARRAPDAPPPAPEPGTVRWGAFEGQRLVATAADRAQGHWYGGRLVPASGLASVSVAPEDRGRGHAQALLRTLLGAVRDRGAAVMTLFPTAPALYRGLGCEQVGVLTWAELPTAALARVRLPAGLSLRSASADDEAAVAGLYRNLARSSNGYLDRTPPRVAPAVGSFDGVTLVVDPAGAVRGYLAWDRGDGYGGTARLTAYDVVARDADATTALLAALGSWGSVTPTLRLRLADTDPVHWAFPTAVPVTSSATPWMLRLVDAAAAVAARGWPRYARASVHLLVADETCPWNAGRVVLTVADGVGRLEPGGAGEVRIGPRGLALLWAGGTTAAALRRGGLLEGGSERTDRELDSVASGPPPALLDYF